MVRRVSIIVAANMVLLRQIMAEIQQFMVMAAAKLFWTMNLCYHSQQSKIMHHPSRAGGPK